MPENKYDDPHAKLPKSEAAMAVLDNLDYSEKEMVDTFRGKWDEWQKGYRNYVELDETEAMTKSNFALPLIPAQIDAMTARVAGLRPRIQVWERESGDVQRAEMHRDVIKYYWQRLDMMLNTMSLVKAGLIYGTSCGKITYRRDVRPTEREVERLVPRGGGGFLSRLGGVLPFPGLDVSRETLSGATDTWWDDPYFDLREIDQVYPDPNGKDADQCRYIIDTERVSLSQIKAAKLGGEPLYNPEVVRQLEARARKMANPLELKVEDGETLKERRERVFGGERSERVDERNWQVTLVEQWTDGKVVTVVNEFPELDPIRDDTNRYGMKPFVFYTPIPFPNEFYGISLTEWLYSLWLEINELHNARMDHLNSSVHRMWKVRKGTVNPRLLRWRPDGVVPVWQMDDVEEMAPRPMQFALYRETSELREWAQLVGISDPAIGLEAGGNTATEASILAQASSSKAAMMFQILSYQTLTRLGRIFMRMTDLHKTRQQTVQILGETFQPPQQINIDPNVLSRGKSSVDLDVIIDVATTEPETRQVRLQRALNGIQTVGQIPIEAWLNPVLQQFGLEALEGFDRERPDQVIEQLKQMALASLQSQGGQGPIGTLPTQDQATNTADQRSADLGALVGGRTGL